MPLDQNARPGPAPPVLAQRRKSTKLPPLSFAPIQEDSGEQRSPQTARPATSNVDPRHDLASMAGFLSAREKRSNFAASFRAKPPSALRALADGAPAGRVPLPSPSPMSSEAADDQLKRMLSQTRSSLA